MKPELNTSPWLYYHNVRDIIYGATDNTIIERKTSWRC